MQSSFYDSHKVGFCQKNGESKQHDSYERQKGKFANQREEKQQKTSY